MDFSEYENIEIFNNTQSFIQINERIGKLRIMYCRAGKSAGVKLLINSHFLVIKGYSDIFQGKFAGKPVRIIIL